MKTWVRFNNYRKAIATAVSNRVNFVYSNNRNLFLFAIVMDVAIAVFMLYCLYK